MIVKWSIISENKVKSQGGSYDLPKCDSYYVTDASLPYH